MATMTFNPMSAQEIAKLNDRYRVLLPSSVDAEAARAGAADEARLHFVRWEQNGSYYKNTRNELVFGTNTGGFIAPPQTTFEYEDD